MASMNNWLAFSLSPQELPSSQSQQSHSPSAAVSHLISGAADDVSPNCYGLSADSTSEPPMGIPTLRPDASFGILEAFNRPHHQTQDWSMKSLDFKGAGSSELSILVGSSSNQNNMEEDEPKLEDFLGGNSFSDHDHKVLPAGLAGAYHGSGGDEYMFSNSPFQVQDASMVTSSVHDGSAALMNGGGASSNSIGLSMIKTWLRNQPIPQQQQQANINSSSSSDMAGTGTTTTTNCGSAMVATIVGSFSNNSQSLSLSMSTGSQSSSALPLMATGGESSSSENNKQKGVGGSLDAQTGAIEAVSRKSVDTFGQRTSIYRGVTRHRWTGRYEAHLWDNSCRREGQTRKGRQVYLGGYDKEEKAARAYDLAALKYWGPTTTTNFPISNYEKELEEMKHMTRQEFVASLRRKSSGFSRGASIYRGVTRHHQHGRWQARIGRVAGNKDLYLGTFSTQEEAAEAYDIAAIKFRGLNAVTNFDMSRYDVKSILESNTLPIGGAAKRLKDVAEHAEASVNGRRTDVLDDHHLASQFDGAMSGYAAAASLHHQGWPTIAFHQPQPPLAIQYPYGGQPRAGWCKQEQDPVVAAAHSLQDLHQLQLGTAGSTHNFFLQAPPSSVLHNLAGVDSSSLEHSTGSNSVLYNGGNMAGCGYVMPMSTVVTDQSHGAANHGSCSNFVDSEGKQMGYDHGTMGAAAADHPYSFSTRNAYYLSQQFSSGNAKGNEYDPSNAWMPASAQAMASRSNGMQGGGGGGGGHGAPLFTVWNDA